MPFALEKQVLTFLWLIIFSRIFCEYKFFYSKLTLRARLSLRSGIFLCKHKSFRYNFSRYVNKTEKNSSSSEAKLAKLIENFARVRNVAINNDDNKRECINVKGERASFVVNCLEDYSTINFMMRISLSPTLEIERCTFFRQQWLFVLSNDA